MKPFNQRESIESDLTLHCFLITWIYRTRMLLLSPPAAQSSFRVGTPPRHRSSYLSFYFAAMSTFRIWLTMYRQKIAENGWHCLSKPELQGRDGGLD